MSEATRERVLESVRLLDYTPNAAARALVGNRSQLIGVVVNTGDHPTLRHPFFQDVLAGLKDSVGVRDYDLLIFSSNRSAGSYYHQPFLRRALHHHIDGLVLMGVDRNDPDLHALLERGLPMVAVDLDLTGTRAGYVMSDNLLGARLAVGHLAELGHERIATITGLPGTSPGSDRLLGYRAELEARSLSIHDAYVVGGDFYPESGYAGAQRLLALPEPPTAIFAASDEMAAGALNAIDEAGLSVPHDISVVGFDDDQLAPLLSPPLTTVRQEKAALGHEAGAAVVALIESDDAVPPTLVLPVRLVVRVSSAPPAR